MQHQYWITKQTLSRKFGRKEDDCIVSSDAQLDAKLELFRNIQVSCTLIQRVIDRYQESICYLSQELNSLGRFLKECSEEDKTHAGNFMLSVGKSFTFCAQQHLSLHEPLIRFYEELETFRQRAIGDTFNNIFLMEKARTEYRAALSWMKNVSLQLDPDTSKQVEKFKKVQAQVRRGKMNFDKLSLDCLQKVDLLAAARCNMLNHILSSYQSKLITYNTKSVKACSIVSKSNEHYQDNTNHFDSDLKIRGIQKFGNNNVLGIGSSCINDSEITSLSNNKTVLSGNNDTSILDDTNTENCIDFDKIEISDNLNYVREILDDKSFSDLTNEKLLLQDIQNLQNSFMEECTDVLNSISKNEIKPSNPEINNDNMEDDENFFPSSLWRQSIRDATSSSKLHCNNISKSLKEETMKKNRDTKSWLNLFDEIDPLSNKSNENSARSSNSLV